ncbi:MAG: SPOR domain-containing protein, partial [Acidobacteriota bacterium]
MRTGTILLALLTCATTAAAQQGSVQVSASTQIVRASDQRLAGQQPFEPDLGLTLYQPAFRLGNLFADLHVVRRNDGVRLGTTALGLRDFKAGGVTWSAIGGDSSFLPSLSAYAFTNLFAPQVTFAGGNVSGFSSRASVTFSVGRVTALRNIFGTDPQAVDQNVAQFQAKVRSTPRVEWLAHGSRVRSGNTYPYTSYTDASADAGGGVRVRPIPTFELTGDAGLSSFQRHGSSAHERSVTALVGGKWALSRGWLEVNAQRFSPGYFAVINTPYIDRAGGFVAGELEVAAPLRVFGGAEAYRTNLDPIDAAAATVAMPRGLAERAFAGARLHIGGRNFLTLRTEQGDRSAKPSGRFGTAYDSDTGVTTAEFQASVRDLSAFARYERRENLDRANGAGTYTQQTASTQIFGQVTRGFQVFGSAMFIDQARQEGGQTFWQGGGGLQVQVPRRQLWARAEGLLSRTDEWGADVDLPHELYTFGLTGQLTAQTSIAIDVMLDRAPQLTSPSSPWLTRSMIRLTRRIPTGTARVPSSTGTAVRRRGTARIFGVAFADWNGNGLMDPGEEPIAGVPFLYSDIGGAGAAAGTAGVPVSSGSDGEFAFVNVPEGRARVGLDLAALPVDFDPPEPSMRDTEARGKPRDKLAFGLVPLGSISGAVRQDSDNDGVTGAADAPVEGAGLVLDDGARSEQTREGQFRFDAVRAGVHTVKLLPESLPEGLSMTGAAQVDLVLDRAQLHRDVAFLVKVEKRPEIRKVFPPKVVAKGRAVETPALTTRPADVASPSGVTVAAPASRPAAEKAGTWYAIQLAATSNRARAWEL